MKQPNLQFAILATDIVIFTLRDDQLLVRLQNVNRPPHFNNIPGLPGGLVSPTETAEETVTRLIESKALLNSSKVHIEQLYTFSALDRDPRGRVVSVAYLALVPWESLSALEQENSAEVWWQEVYTTKELAYDHATILSYALKRLQSRIMYTTLASKLVPSTFTLTHLEKIYSVILDTPMDKRNFRKKILTIDVLKKSNVQLRGVRHRPASLYSFRSQQITDITII